MKKITIKTLLLGFLVISLASCLKEGKMNTNPADAKNLIEFNNTGDMITVSGVPGFYNDLGVLAVGGSSKFNINVHYAGIGTAPEDITVKLAVDQAVLTKYNTDNGTSKVIPASTIYSFPTDVVIKKGTSQTTVQATISVTAAFDYNAVYALPLKIASVSSGTISGNFGSIVYSFGVRNKYDGIYRLKGYHNRVPYDAPYNEVVSMMTTGATSIAMYWNGKYAHPIMGGSSYYGSMTANFTFNSSEQLTAWDWTPYATPYPTTVDPTSNSRYDPATKTIYFKGWYNNNPSARCFYDTLTYIGPR